MTEGWLARIVEDFWARAREPEPFPRNLERPIMWALPLAVVKLPRLWVRDVEVWLERRGIRFQLGCDDRPLHGCLVAYGGRGCVLLDGADPKDEQRFSLAHETGHFLLEYLLPRERAVSQLGTSILEVFDGLRAPTVEERVHAVLGHVPIGVHTHLMERRTNTVPGCGKITGAEARADRLALELLAPAAEVRRMLARLGHPARAQERLKLAREVLTCDFGLPPSVAVLYSKTILGPEEGEPSVKEWLDLRQDCRTFRARAE